MKQKTCLSTIAMTLILLTSTVFGATVTPDPGGTPTNSYIYAVEVQGMLTGYFTHVSGIGSETEIVEHKVVTGSGVEVVMKVPGRLKWHNITLKRGITSDMDAWVWRKMVENGDVVGARQNMSIVLYDQAGTELARWNFENAWPSKISAYSDADGNVIEELVIVHEFYERAN